MYILIFEDGGIGYTDKLHPMDFDYVTEGLLSIVDVDKKRPLMYISEGNWVEIEYYGN